MQNFYKIDYKILTIFMLFSFSNVFSQCLNPSFFQSHSTTINSSVIQWTDVNEAEYYRVSFRQIGEDWQFAGLPINIPFGTNQVELNNLEEYTTYQYRIRTYCNSGSNSEWSTVQQFTTESSLIEDCNGVLDGSAYIDDCGNCVGGNTGSEPCIAFTPTISISISSTDPLSISDINFTIEQDANEPDMASSMFLSDGGSFAISSLFVGQSVGQGFAQVGGGFMSSEFTLYVSNLSDDNNATLSAVDNQDGSIYSTFELSNTSEGVQVTSVAPSDGNNITNGNNLSVTLSQLYVTPQNEVLNFYTSIVSESSVTDNQTFTFDIGITDCNGDFNGSAYIDDCGNCVGGNTGSEPCVEFAPAIELNFSTTECEVLSDVELIITQSPNQPDMSSSTILSDEGSFDFSTLQIDQIVGETSLELLDGQINFEADLVVASISDNQVQLTAVSTTNSSVLGTINLTNNQDGGIMIDANSSYDDGNNVTSGNLSYLQLVGIFENPSQQVNFSINTFSENDDEDIQLVSIDFECPCDLPGDANCDNIVNLADLTLVLNNWLSNVELGTNGDVVGSNDGFVNLDDLTLVLNNWLATN